MTKVHFCCGDIYLKGYINIDIDGYLVDLQQKKAHYWFETAEDDPYENEIVYDPQKSIDLSKGNPNETTLENYFKYPWEPDPLKRQKIKRPFILDRKANIIRNWPFDDNSLDEVIMISCIEHFDPKTELPHIIKELNRTIKVGGKLLIDWPDIKGQVDKFYGIDDQFLMELIYCNHKNKYSIHHWGFTSNTFPKYLGDHWRYEFKPIVEHEYPMQGCIATKIYPY